MTNGAPATSTPPDTGPIDGDDRHAPYKPQPGAKVAPGLYIVATPIVDSSSIDAALAKAHSLNSALRSIGASATPPPPG